MKKLLTSIVLLFLVPVAFADSSSSNNLAINMLGEIFGYLPPLSGHMGVMNLIVHKLNLAIFSLIGLYCTYTTSMVVHDLFQGGLQGKSNHIMMAGRLALATALLAPLPQAGYYSAYQTIVMQTVVGGIKLADTVWHTASLALTSGLSLDSQTVRKAKGKVGAFHPVDENPASNGLQSSSVGSPVIQALLAHDMCMRFSQKMHDSTKNYQAANYSNFIDDKTINRIGFPGGFDDSQSDININNYGCGYFNYGQYPGSISKIKSAGVKDLVYQGARSATYQALNILDPVVESIVSGSVSPTASAQFDISGPPKPNTPVFNLTTSQAQALGLAIAKAEIAYANTMGTMVAPIINQQMTLRSSAKKNNRKLFGGIKSAENTSFMMAGNYINQMMAQNSINTDTDKIGKPVMVNLSKIVTKDGHAVQFSGAAVKCMDSNSDVCKVYNSFMNNISPLVSSSSDAKSVANALLASGNNDIWTSDKKLFGDKESQVPMPVDKSESSLDKFRQFILNAVYSGQQVLTDNYKLTQDNTSKAGGVGKQISSGAKAILGPVSVIVSLFFPGITSTGKLMTDFLSPTVNPFQFMFSIGQDMLSIAGIMLFGKILAQQGEELIVGSKWANQFLGVGAAAKSNQDNFKDVRMMLGLYMLGVGIFLVYVVPLMPFLYYLFAILGWFMCVIEAIFAGTVMPILLADPGGQHPFWGKAETAVMLLLNLFLQPVLIVLGLICSILLSFVALRLLNLSFGAVIWNSFANLAGVHLPAVNLSSMDSSSASSAGKALAVSALMISNLGHSVIGLSFSGGVERLLILLVSIPLIISFYALMVYQIMSFCFTMISELPKRVSRWIGIQPHQSQEQQAVQAFTGSITQGTGQVGQYYAWRSVGNSLSDESSLKAKPGSNQPESKEN